MSGAATEIRAERLHIIQASRRKRDFKGKCFKRGKAWPNWSTVMKAYVEVIDQQLSVDMSKDCRSKETNAFEMDEENSAEI